MRKSLWLSVLSVVLLPPASAGQSKSNSQPPQNIVGALATDHITHSVCRVKSSKDFATYCLYFHVEYTDKAPFDLFVESSGDPDSLYDQCEAFLLEMEAAQIREAVRSGKEEMKKKRDEHFFLNVKVAKR